MQESEEKQLDLLSERPTLVHYFDKNGALHTGTLVKKIKKGKKRGQYIVMDPSGKRFIPPKIRNIEILS